MNILKFKASKTTRVIISKGRTDKCFVVLHGYGMNVNRFYRYLNMLEDLGHSVVVPEAMSRYYDEGASGNVVANWMTREERDDDIQDNHQYLIDLLNHLKSEDVIKEQHKIHLVGYSQGAATAARFSFMEFANIESLTLWGSLLAPDIPDADLKMNRNSLKVHLLIGDSDEFVSVPDVEANMEKLRKLDVETDIFIYKGGHRVSADGLKHLSEI